MAHSSHGGTARAILYAFLANGGIAIAKTWAAAVTGSGSARSRIRLQGIKECENRAGRDMATSVGSGIEKRVGLR